MQTAPENDLDDHIEPDPNDPNAIPNLARAWQSTAQVVAPVRRPSTLPDPQSYHRAIEPESIFELDEKQNDGSIETVLVIPFSCKRCKTLKQACSRKRPTCLRCRKAGLNCEVMEEGYQRLKLLKNANTVDQAPEKSCEQSRNRRVSSKLSQIPTTGPDPPAASGSKRPLSPGSDPARSRKKTKAKTTSRKGEAGRLTVAPPKETGVEYPDASKQQVSALVSADKCTKLEWTLVNVDNHCVEERERMQSIPSNTLIPRVWTNSLDGLMTVFPELAKSNVRFSWFQSEAPVLLLESNYAAGRWINSTALTIDMIWNFSCRDSELEPIAESNTNSSPEKELDHDVRVMGFQSGSPPPTVGPLPMRDTETPSLHDALRSEQFKVQGTDKFNAGWCDSSVQLGGNSMLLDSLTLCPPASEPPSHPPALAEPPAQPAAPHPDLLPRVPLDKPPEVETLLNSRLHSIPLLLWIPHDSILAPCVLPLEYAYLCMGFFFISNLQHSVLKYDPSTSGVVQGQVCWSVTLQWAPGGEEALFMCDPASPSDVVVDPVSLASNVHLSHPWWYDPTNAQADDMNPQCPRDLRMQFFSFIPLDLLAEFHPSESFPRGWFCKSCGLINVQEFFRHQICRSTACGSTRDKRVPAGKADPLSSLRGHYQSSALIQPSDNVPSVVVSRGVDWNDGMQSWIYSARDGVTLCHVFTGNQGNLQGDANALLESVQCELLLRKEGGSSPYYVHSTKVSHPSDGSEATVPAGTPDCVRTAYYTLCHFVYRYGEMGMPRFGEVRILAWVNPGTRKGIVLRASKSPVVLHCLGAEVVINVTPKGGYEECRKSAVLDKGKGRAVEDKDRRGSPSVDLDARSSRHVEHDDGGEPSFVAWPEMDATVLAETVVEAACADGVQEPGDEAATPALTNAPHCDPGMEAAANHEVAARVPEKTKATKDKSKASAPKISITLVHGDGVVLSGDDFEHQIVRTGTSILVIGFPESEI